MTFETFARWLGVVLLGAFLGLWMWAGKICRYKWLLQPRLFCVTKDEDPAAFFLLIAFFTVCFFGLLLSAISASDRTRREGKQKTGE